MKIGTTMIALGALLAAQTMGAAASPAPSLFDTPVSSKTVEVPAAGDVPAAKVTCAVYANFAVKQIDEGEVGAAQLSIAPIAAGAKPPACVRANVAGEKVIDPAEWAGYFQGVKGNFVFISSADGSNGAMGFAVYTLDAKKLFDDWAVGDFTALTADASTLTARYRRSVAGPCSVVHEGAACWAKVASAAQVSATPAPDCKAGYQASKTALAKGRCEADQNKAASCPAKMLKEIEAQRFDESPSVVTFDVETVIAGGKATTKALGAAQSCTPAD